MDDRLPVALDRIRFFFYFYFQKRRIIILFVFFFFIKCAQSLFIYTLSRLRMEEYIFSFVRLSGEASNLRAAAAEDG